LRSNWPAGVHAARSRGKFEAAAEEIAKAGGAAIAIPADVSIENDCRELMEKAIAAHGAIDVLVCNAGIGSATQGDDLIAIEAVRRTMAVNFMGMRRLRRCRRCRPRTG
jgi:NAD(P)-dependent dehydrogenase (short-subunit alcohol dehydrogenase family)